MARSPPDDGLAFRARANAREVISLSAKFRERDYKLIAPSRACVARNGFRSPRDRVAPPPSRAETLEEKGAMTPKVVGHRQFTDGVTRPVYEDERGQFIEEDGDRVDGVWLVPEEDGADTPVIVEAKMV
jgi:hypothetical protein